MERRTIQTRVLVKGIFIGYVGGVITLCLSSFSNINITLPTTLFGIGLDKYFHFLMFLPYPMIGWLTYHASRHLGRYPKYALIAAFASGVVFAISTELAQMYLTVGRSGEFADFVADLCGLVVGTIIISTIGKKVLTFLK